MLLKSIEQTLTFRVQGYDFIKDSPDIFGPNPIPEALPGIIVEITAVDTFELTREMLPPITDVTDENGEVTFVQLPGLSYKVEAKALGYFTESFFIDPDADGMLPTDIQIIDITAEPHGLIVFYEFPDYLPPQCAPGIKGRIDVARDRFNGPLTEQCAQELRNLEIVVQGLEGTATEGVERRAFCNEFQLFDCKPAGLFLSGLFKPGRYKMVIRGVARNFVSWTDSNDNEFDNEMGVAVFFEDYIEFDPEGPDAPSDPFAFFRKEHTVALETEAEVVTGRLLAAETTEITTDNPIYRPLPHQEITFHQPFNLDLFGDFSPVTVTSDANGFYSVDLLPGIYAVELPGLTDYFGDGYIYEVKSEEGGSAMGDIIEGRWPFFEEWPSDRAAFSPAAERFNGNGIGISGGDAPRLDLLVRKELYTLKLGVDTSGPTDFQVVYLDHDAIPPHSHVVDHYQLVRTGGVAEVVGTVTGSQVTPLRIERRDVGLQNGRSPQVFARWDGLTADTYAFNLSDNNYSFQNSGLGPSVFIDYPVPGGVPSLAVAEILENNNFDDDPAIPLTPEIRGPIDAFEFDIPIVVDARRWTEIMVDGELVGSYEADVVNIFGVFTATGYAPGFYVTTANPPAAPIGGSQVYVTDRFNSNDFYLVANGGTVFIGGPSATPKVSRPEPAFNLEIQAVAEQDDNVPVAGVKLFLDEGGDDQLGITTAASPVTFSNLTQSPIVTDDPSDDFVVVSVPPPFEIVAGERPTVRTKVLVERAIEIIVTVKNAQTGALLEGVLVELRTVYGGRVGNISPPPRQPTDASGKATLSGQRLQNYYVVVEQPGFEICRVRLPTSDLQEVAGVLTHTTEISLIPIAGPVFTPAGVPFNRFGAFLPGVTRSGSASAFDLFSAKDALTATWTAEIMVQDLDYLVPAFDNRDGTLASEQDTVQQTDVIRDVYLIDRREFEKSGFQGNSTPLTIPPVIEPLDVQRLVQKIIRGKSDSGEDAKSTTFLSRSESIADGSTPDKKTVTGKLKLWELPAGDFKPALLVRSQSGAFGAMTIDYEGTGESAKRLTGIAVPGWLGFAFDILGVSAGVSATQAEIKKYVPDGKFIPFPDFTAKIEEAKDGDNKTGFIDYTYSLTVGTEVGQDSPAGGLASLGPGLLGAKISTMASITSIGANRQLRLSMATTITGIDIDVNEYVPKIASTLGVEPSVKAGGGVTTTFIQNADVNKPFDLRLSSEIGGNVDLKLKMNLSTVTGKIPYVGLPLTLLDKTGNLQTFGTASAGIGFLDRYCWETLRPEQRTVNTTTDPDPRSRRRHFLGGNELDEDTADDMCMSNPDLCIRFSVGLEAEAKALGFALGGDVKLALEGQKCGIPEASSLKISFNTFGDYPVVKRVQGDVNLKLNAFVKTPIKNFTKKYTWNLIKIDAQYGTETVVQLIPMELEFGEQSFSSSGASVFTTKGPDLVVAVAPVADFSADAGSADVILAPLFNETTGKVELRIAPRDDDLSWASPEMVVDADFIGVNTVARLSDGRILVAWSEPNPASDPTDILGSSFVKFSISDTNGENFSVPAFASFPSGVVVDLLIRESGDNIGLFFRMVQGSRLSPAHQLIGLLFDDQTDMFGSAIFLGQDTAGMRELQVCGGGPGAAGDFLIAFVNEDNELRTLRWDGDSLLSISVLDNDIVGGLAGHADSMAYDLIVAALDGRLLHYHSDSGIGSTLAAAIEVGAGATPTEAHLVQQDVTVDGGFVYVFTESTVDGAEIRYLYLTSTFAVADDGVLDLTGNSQGRYSKLRVSRRSAQAAYVYALFENSPAQIRVFEISVISGTSSNDNDDDGVNDVGELLIVDFDGEDGIEGVGDVVGSDDFDADTFDNATEIAAGTDPTDSLSFPVTPVIVGSTSELVFDSIEAAGMSAPQSVQISSMGNGPLTVGDVSIQGDDADAFLLQNDLVANSTIAVQNSHSLDVVFSPRLPGLNSAELNIPSDDPNTPNLMLSLSGTALSAADSDGDGLPDTYESAFSSDGMTTSLDPGADDDMDNFINLTEYLNASAPNDDMSTPTGDPFDIVQRAGWNLLSSPRALNDKRVSRVFNNLNSGPVWHMAAAAAPFNYTTATRVSEYEGFWIYFPETLPYSPQMVGDRTSAQSITLHSGWNLVGVQETVMRPVDAALEPSIWFWNVDHFETADTHLHPGVGYFVFSHDDDVAIAVRLVAP